MSTTVMSSNDLSTMDLLSVVKMRNPEQDEFYQAVEEVYQSIQIVLKKRPQYRKLKIFDRIVEPERVVSFRVPWVDDNGEVQINRGIRVQSRIKFSKKEN